MIKIAISKNEISDQKAKVDRCNPESKVDWWLLFMLFYKVQFINMKFRVIIIKVVLKKIITIAMWSLQILKLTLGIVSIYIVYLLTSLLN